MTVTTPQRTPDTHTLPAYFKTRHQMMPDRSDYQPLPQTADDEPDLDPEVFSTATSSTRPRARGIRGMNAPGAIDMRKLDAAFKRFVVSLS
jgi:hypothetical protein